MNQLPIDEILPKVPENKKTWKIRIGLALLCLLVSITACLLGFSKKKDTPTMDNRYMELTVVGNQGYAVPGVVVYINSNFEGITDSFGQLRKSFFLLSNSTLDITLEKKNKKSNTKLNVANYKKDIRANLAI